MKNSKISENDLIKAGAVYRLGKTVLHDNAHYLSGLLNLYAKDTSKIISVLNKFESLETKIGFEDIAYQNEFSGNVIDLFYGGINTCHTETDRAVMQEIKNMLLAYIQKIDKVADGTD